MRGTANAAVALERLATMVTELTVSEAEERGRWIVITNTDPWGLGPTNKRTANCLAMLADLASRQKDAESIRAEVNWTGRIPLSGLAAHEEAALLWLRREV